MHKYGLIGLGAMGQGLSRNFSNNNISIGVYNRTTEKQQEFIKQYGNEFLSGYDSLDDLVKNIEKPRKLLLSVKSGDAVDEVINKLKDLLDPEDIIIDTGNSYYLDTEVRLQDLSERGIKYLGMGVSGGSEGALNGPSLMVGGNKSAYKLVQEDLSVIAAKDFNKGDCVAYIGQGGAGHFVKMVHNAIEYPIMQLIAEIYDYLENNDYDKESIADMFESWLRKGVRSYLLEITIDILRSKDELTKEYLLDVIMDKAADKGTGMWSVIESIELKVPAPSIAEAVFARYISIYRDLRIKHNVDNDLKYSVKKTKVNTDVLAKIYYAISVLIYEQGFQLISAGAKEFDWEIKFSEIARIWQGGCIIRAQYLKDIQAILEEERDFDLMGTDFIQNKVSILFQDDKHIKNIVSSNIPTPVIAATYNYLLGYTRRRLPTNLVQAQRDYFGEHGYERLDRKGEFSGGWTKGTIGTKKKEKF